MIVGTLELNLRLPGVRSLKEKRQVLRSLIEKCRRDFGVSISEVDDHDLWGNATVGVARVGSNAVQVEAALQRVLEIFDGSPEANVDNFYLDVDRT
jgi:uncharacterized protein YlxP (DUF503 family)